MPLVHESVELDGHNATGRQRLTYHYKRPRTWSDDERLLAARRLIERYFMAVGGFRLACQRVMAAWYAALEIYNEEEIRWAIDAKAASLKGATREETREKRMFANRPENFPDAVGHWLQQSPQWAARRDREEESDRRRRDLKIDERMRARQAEDDRFRATGDTAGLARVQAAREARSRELDIAREAAEKRAWDQLSQKQRWAAIRATESRFRQQAECSHLNPEDPVLDVIRRSHALHWADRQWPHLQIMAPVHRVFDQAHQAEHEQRAADAEHAELQRRQAAREQADRERQATDEAAQRAVWEALSDAQRQEALTATESLFHQLAPDGPGDSKHEKLRREIALDWARKQWPESRAIAEKQLQGGNG